MNTDDTFWLTTISNVQTGCIGLASWMFFLIPKKGRNEFLGIGLMMWLSFTADIVSNIGWYTFRTNMNLVINIFNILNLPFAVIFYRRMIPWRHMNVVAGIIVFVHITFGIVSLFWIQGVRNINSYSYVLGALGITVLSIAYFFVLMSQRSESIVKLDGRFWINTSLLILNSVHVTHSIAVDYFLKTTDDDLITAWAFRNALGIMSAITIAYGFYRIRKELTSVR